MSAFFFLCKSGPKTSKMALKYKLKFGMTSSWLKEREEKRGGGKKG